MRKRPQARPSAAAASGHERPGSGHAPRGERSRSAHTESPPGAHGNAAQNAGQCRVKDARSRTGARARFGNCPDGIGQPRQPAVHPRRELSRRQLSPGLPARVSCSSSRRGPSGHGPRASRGRRRALAVARGGSTGLGREHKLARACPSGANPRAGLQAIDPTATASEFDPGDWTAAGDRMPVTPLFWMLRGMAAATHRCGGAASAASDCSQRGARRPVSPVMRGKRRDDAYPPRRQPREAEGVGRHTSR